MLLSVVVPCFQEEHNVEALWRAVERAMADCDTDFEIVFVDDGSTDGTLLRLRRIAQRDRRVRYLSFSRNFGKESAMLAGLSAARGDAVVLMDGDLQHPPELLRRMLERHAEGFDQVVARRSRVGDPRSRSLSARLYYALVNRLVEVRLDDGMGDFRLLSRAAVDALLALPEYNRFSKGLFSWIGFPTAVVEYDNVPRSAGRSTWSVKRLLDYGVDGILSFNDKPLRLSVYLGLIVTLLSALYVGWLVVSSTVYGIRAPGYVTLVTAVLGIGGLQLVFLGVIGEYIGRIYFETKRRPHYVVKETSGARTELLPGDPRAGVVAGSAPTLSPPERAAADVGPLPP